MTPDSFIRYIEAMACAWIVGVAVIGLVITIREALSSSNREIDR